MEKFEKVFCIMEFETNSRRKRRRGKKNIGFLTAVVLCCAAVCLAGLSSYITERRENASEPTEHETGDEFWTVDETANGDSYEPLGVLSGSDSLVGGTSVIDLNFSDEQTGQEEQGEPDVQSNSSNAVELSGKTQDSTQDEAVTVAKNLIFDPPLPGSVIKEYSGTELVYCSTMGDWRVHRGIDIAGEKGSDICSAADGTVTYVTEDPLYGKTVAVTHSDGSILYYSGFDTVRVKRDDSVKRGEKLGTLGVIPCESSEAAHLHLEMVRDGEYVDPLTMYS